MYIYIYTHIFIYWRERERERSITKLAERVEHGNWDGESRPVCAAAARVGDAAHRWQRWAPPPLPSAHLKLTSVADE